MNALRYLLVLFALTTVAIGAAGTALAQTADDNISADLDRMTENAVDTTADWVPRLLDFIFLAAGLGAIFAIVYAVKRKG